MKAIITMPNYDDATSYLYCYAEELIKFAERKNITVIQLKRPKLRKKILEESITKQDPQLLLFNAHGDETTIYGDKVEGKEEYLIREGENHHFLIGKLTYARACSAAASLGKICTQKNGCFIGYNQPFSFWTDTSRTTTPLKDKIAQLFLRPSNELAIALLRGKSAQEAADIFFNMSKKSTY
ncbi:MAG: hypothetical protein Q8R53_05790 [Nanoarchaeota archaeon]|nr:hypothetical protein [Nanoarchaeota archaeon]